MNSEAGLETDSQKRYAFDNFHRVPEIRRTVG